MASALLALHSITSAQPAPTPASTNGEDVTLDKFEVTGSRIRRTDIETPAPVIRYVREDFKSSGYATIGETIQNLPFNTGGSIDPQRTSTFATGARTLNLRGLGSRNTLILVNGRRVSPYGLSGGNGFDSVGDLNSIPDFAVQSFTVVKDGNSAIYGSDAVAGVVDIQTRKNFTGGTVQVEINNTTNKDAFGYTFGAGFGATADKTKIVGFFDWSERNGAKLSDRDFSATADLRRYGGRDSRSTATFPGRVVLPANNPAGLPAGGRTFDAPTSTPTVAGSVPYVGFTHNYNPNPPTDLLTPGRAYGTYLYGEQDLGSNISFFGEVIYRKNSTKIEVAAPPVVGQNENGTSSTGKLVLPATNPFNPFGIDISDAALAFRLVEIGPRTTDVDSSAPRFLAGLKGKFAETWTWETAVMYSSNEVTSVNTNQALDRQVQAALSGVRVPKSGRTLYLNPFGPSDPELIDFLRATYNRSSKFELYDGDATVSGELFTLPAGPVGLAVGAEVRREKLASTRSEDERTGQIIGGSEGFSTFGSRRIKSAYTEFSVPIFKGTPVGSLEAQLAVRYEDYSDFGDTTKPKIGLGWKVTPWLMLRGTFSQAFKAPDLAQLYNGGTVSFTSGNQTDPRRPSDPARQGRIVTVGNLQLQPEETDVTYAGLVFAPKKNGFAGFLDGFEATFDYFIFKTSDRITDFVADFGYAAILNGEAAGNPLFVPLVQRAEPTADDNANGRPGALLQVNNTFRNIAQAQYQGWDVSLRYDWQINGVGRFRAQTDWTYVESNDFDGFEAVDTFTFPRYRGTSSLRWQVKDWRARVTVNYLAGYDDSTVAATALGGNGLLNRIGSYTAVTPALFYTGFRNLEIELGVNNVFDRDPPRSYVETPGYDNLNVSGLGRLVYLRVTREW